MRLIRAEAGSFVRGWPRISQEYASAIQTGMRGDLSGGRPSLSRRHRSASGPGHGERARERGCVDRVSAAKPTRPMSGSPHPASAACRSAVSANLSHWHGLPLTPVYFSLLHRSAATADTAEKEYKAIGFTTLECTEPAKGTPERRPNRPPRPCARASLRSRHNPFASNDDERTSPGRPRRADQGRGGRRREAQEPRHVRDPEALPRERPHRRAAPPRPPQTPP